MKIVSQDIESFAKDNSFDFYIVDEFSLSYVPVGTQEFLIKDFTAADLERLTTDYSERCGEIVAIGAGAVLDPAKFLASKFEKKLTVIPTALSTNSFATNRSSFLSGKAKVSYATKAPDVVVIDKETIQTAGILNSFGVIEVSATCPARIDWSLAQVNNNERGNKEISDRAEALIGHSIHLLQNASDLPKHLDEPTESLSESGKLTVAYGVGRPVSGSEHIISAYIENKFHCPHGAGLYIGIQIANRLHEMYRISDQETETISDLLREFGEIQTYVRTHIPETELKRCLQNLCPRDDRYTILDMATLDDLSTAIDEICATIYCTTL